MSRYELIWRWFAIVVASAGLFLELITRPLSVLIALIGLAVGVAVCVTLSLRMTEADAAGDASAATAATRTPMSAVLGWALLAALALAALIGLATLSPIEMLGIGALVGLTSPPVVRRLLGLTAPRQAAAAPPAGAQRVEPANAAEGAPPYGRIDVGRLTQGDVSSMRTDDLVRDWRRSYIALEQASDPATKMTLVERRQAYLDELERRYPDGLHDWLESGARAAGDPTKFVAGNGEQNADGSQAA